MSSALVQRWAKGDYDTIYFGVQSSATDPALSPQFWLSSGNFHFWNPEQPAPATEWERRIDELFRQQAADLRVPERQRLVAEAVRILEDEVPAIYFVAPKVTLAVSSRVANPQPAPQIPQLLWSATRSPWRARADKSSPRKADALFSRNRERTCTAASRASCSAARCLPRS